MDNKRLSFSQRVRLAGALATKIIRADETKQDPVFPRTYWGSLWNSTGDWGTISNALFGRGLGRLYSGTNIDYASEIGDLASSSMVMAVWQYIGTSLTEAPPMVKAFKPGDTTGEPVPDHPLVELFKQPNDFYDGATLMLSFALDWLFSGDVYWIKVREPKYLTPIQIWYVPYFMIQPMGDPNNPRVFVKEYIYSVDGQKFAYPVEDIVHLRRGINPRNIRQGIGVFDSVLREIYADNMASNFAGALLKNWGVVPFVISPKKNARGETENPFGDNVEAARARATDIKNQFVAGTTGDERGKPIVNTIPLEVTKLGFSPSELDISALRKIPESRIAAVSGLPAALLQFLVGLEHGTSYAAYKEAREQAYESVVVPLLRTIATAVNKQLMPDFGDAKGRRLEFSFDLSGVRVLQEDQDKLFTRLTGAVDAGWLLISDARSATGLPFEETDKIYLRGGMPVKFGEEMQPPAPPEPGTPGGPPIDGQIMDERQGKLPPQNGNGGKPKVKPKQLTAGKGSLFKYSEDQPRDDHGRFASIGDAPLFTDEEHVITVLPSFITPAGAEIIVPAINWTRVGKHFPIVVKAVEKINSILEFNETFGEGIETFIQQLLAAPGSAGAGAGQSLGMLLSDAKRPFGRLVGQLGKAIDTNNAQAALIAAEKLMAVAYQMQLSLRDEEYRSEVDDLVESMEELLTSFGDDPGAVAIALHNYNAVKSLKYSDDQPRDSHGRFTSGGGESSSETGKDSDLHSYLKTMSEIRGAPPTGFKYNSIEQLVLKEGQSFTATPLPDDVKDGELGLCYMNAYHLVEDHPELEYVEGYAQTSRLPIPLEHAWAVTKDGNVVDPTWNRFFEKGETISYFGVKIPIDTVRKTILAREKYGVLNDMEQGFPLLKSGISKK